MPLPTESTSDDQQLMHYVLGLLTEDEAERLDEASITDDEVALRLGRVENDLVDAYVTNTLDQRTRENFEAAYLTSARRREKVRFARRFLAVVDRASVATTPPPTVAGSRADRVRQFSPRPGSVRPTARRLWFSWPILTTAASLVIACGVLVSDLQPRIGVGQAEPPIAAQHRIVASPVAPSAEARTQSTSTTKALERERVGSASREGSSGASQSAAAGASVPASTTVAILFPETRSIGQPPIVSVPPGDRSIAFDLRLESNDFPRYRALLKDPTTNQLVWRGSPQPARSAASSVVPLIVPSSVLASQHYLFELAGVDVDGNETTIGSYAVQIDRR
jgi:hypothetical protein